MTKKIHADLSFAAVLMVVTSLSFWLSISTAVAKTQHTHTPGAQASEDLAKNHTEIRPATWKQIRQLCDVTLKQHVYPPTKQQLILAAARGIYLAQNKLPPPLLAQEMSQSTTDEQYKQLIDTHWKQGLADSDLSVAEVETVMLTSLAKAIDSRARLISAKDLRVEKQLSENRYVGIGIQLVFEDEHAVISNPFVGGAARKAGSKAGDVILEIDGKTTDGMILGKIVQKLRGDRGTKVSVKVRNKHSGKTHVLEMVRDKVPIPTVRGAKRNDDDSWNYSISAQKIAYLRFERIVGSTAAEVKTLAGEIDEQGFKHVILDFRTTGDIDFHHAVMLADSLVGKLELGRYVDAKSSRKLTTRADCCLQGKRLYVITRGNVSGAELVVMTALRNSGATFVGVRVASDGKIGERVELGEGQGALTNLSTALYRPALDADRNHIGPGAMTDLQVMGITLIQPNHPCPPDQAVGKCIELFERATAAAPR